MLLESQIYSQKKGCTCQKWQEKGKQGVLRYKAAIFGH